MCKVEQPEGKLSPGRRKSAEALDLMSPSGVQSEPIKLVTEEALEAATKGAQAEQMWTAVILASCTTFSMGGVVFGMSSLYPMLYKQGFYRSVCGAAQAACPVDMTTKCCEQQFVTFSAVTSVAFFLVDAAAAPWGELADRLGGRFCLGCAVSVSFTGFVMLSIGAYYQMDLLTALALSALALAGPGAFNGGFFGTLELIGDSEPKAKAVLTSLNAAAFDGSALVFMLFHSFSFLLGMDLSVPAIVWGVLCLMMGIYLFFQLPRRDDPDRKASPGSPPPIAPALEDGEPLDTLDDSSHGGSVAVDEKMPSISSKEGMSLLEDAKCSRNGSDSSAEVRALRDQQRELHEIKIEDANAVKATILKAVTDGHVSPAAKSPRNRPAAKEQGGEPSTAKEIAKAAPVYSAVCNRTNWLLVLFMAVYHLVSNFYLETQIDQFERLFGGTTAVQFSTAFNFAFPVGGFCASLPVSWLLQRTEEDAEHIYFGISFALSNLFSVLTLFETKSCQIAAALLFGPVRCLTWASYFQFLATERRYLPELSARAMGYNNVIIAVAGALGPYMLAHLVSMGVGGEEAGRSLAEVVITADDDAGSARYLLVKGCLQGFNLLSGIFPWVLWRDHRRGTEKQMIT